MSPIEQEVAQMLGNLSHVLGGPVTYNGIVFQSTSNLE